MGPETPQPLPASDVYLDKFMSCPFKGLTQTEEPQYPVQKWYTTTIDSPSTLTETMDVISEDGWVTY